MKLLFPLYVIGLVLVHALPHSSGTIAFNKLYFGPLRGDYLLHAAVFLPWMFLILAVNNQRPFGGLKYIVALVAGILIAAACEGLHYWLPYRSFNPMDLVFGVSGVVVSALMVLPLILTQNAKRRRAVTQLEAL